MFLLQIIITLKTSTNQEDISAAIQHIDGEGMEEIPQHLVKEALVRSPLFFLVPNLDSGLCFAYALLMLC